MNIEAEELATRTGVEPVVSAVTGRRVDRYTSGPLLTTDENPRSVPALESGDADNRSLLTVQIAGREQTIPSLEIRTIAAATPYRILQSLKVGLPLSQSGDSPAPQPATAGAIPAALEDVNPRDVLQGAPCAHRWLIGTPAGATSEGVCTLCGDTRTFANSYDEGGPAKKLQRVMERKVIPLADGYRLLGADRGTTK